MIAGLTTNVFCQEVDSVKPLQITNAFLGGQWISNDYQGNSLYFINSQNPFTLELDIQVTAPVKVKYSLYTYKKTFSQDGKRNYVQGIDECGLINPILTQSAIDTNLDKIYEFPVVMETTSGYRDLSWDGYTDAAITGARTPIRDCIYVAAYNADTGELIDTQGANAAKNYQTSTTPSIVYSLDDQKDNNGNIVKEMLSGKIIVGYPDSWPIKKITAFLTFEECGYGATPISVVNQGADAIAANMNSRLPGEVIAHIVLTNPTVDPTNPDIKIFDWKDIKTEDGKNFVPDLVKYPQGYSVDIILDMDDMTYTGVKNGSINNAALVVPPVPKSYTGINTVDADNVKIYPDGSGFNIDCPDGVCATKYRIFDISGRALETGNISGGKIKTATHLNKGNIYVIQVDTDNSTVTRKVIINKMIQ